MKPAWLLFLLLSCAAHATEYREGKETVVTRHQVDSINHLADSLRRSDPEYIRELAGQALTLARQINYLKGQAEAMLYLSSYHTFKEEYVTGLDYLFKILDIYYHLNDGNNLAITYSQISAFFTSIRNYDLAEKYLRLTSQYGNKSSNPMVNGTVFLSHATFFLARHEYTPAIRNLYLSIPYFRKANEHTMEAAVHKYLGDAYVQTRHLYKAEYAYRTAISLLTEPADLPEVAVNYTRIAHIYQIRGDHKKNLEYNLAAMRLREKAGVPSLLASSYLNVGEAYWLLGKKDSASRHLGTALKLAKQLDNTYILEAIYRQLSDFAQAEKRYKEALDYYDLRIRYRNKMIDEQNHAEIAILDASRTIRASEARNDLIMQENLIQDLRISNRRVQTILFELAFLVLMSMILLMDTMVRNNRKRKNELKILNDRLKLEINERSEAEKRLNSSEELHRSLAENTVDVISLLDPHLKRLYISPSCLRVYGYTQPEILAMDSPLNLVDPSYRDRVRERLRDMVQTSKSVRYIYKALRKNGSLFWAEANINPVIEPETGKVKDIITVVRDISERMQHEEDLAENARQKEYLLREIHNRVKNNFTILTSLMNMQRDQAMHSDLNRSLTDLQLRVRTMSLVHEQLYQTREISSIPFDSYVQNLTVIIAGSFSNDRISLHTDIRPCQVSIEMALPMGLIINELITNVYKYAFPANRTGSLWVSLLPEEEGLFSISIRDDGIGLPKDFSLKTTRSMGMQIVEILVQQVEARLEVTSSGGTCFRIIFSPKQD